MSKLSPPPWLALALWALCVLGCSPYDEQRIYATDSGLRSVEVVRFSSVDVKRKQTYHQLRVSDKPPVDFNPLSETSLIEKRDAPFIAVNDPPATLGQRNIVYLPTPNFSAEDADAIARLLGASKEHGISGLRLGKVEDYHQRFVGPEAPMIIVVDVYGAAWFEKPDGGENVYLGEMGEDQSMICSAYAQPTAGQPPLPDMSELAGYVDSQGKTFGETFKLVDPRGATTPTPSPR